MSNLGKDTSEGISARVNRRVLIVTDDVDGSLALVDHLRTLSMDVSLTGYDGTGEMELPDRAPSAVLCFLSDFVEHGPEIVARIRAAYPHRSPTIVGRLMREAPGDHPYDSVLYEPVHAVQVAYRIASLIRLGQIEREIIRRRETMRESFGMDLDLPDTPLRQPFRVLFIGKADPAYMAVVNALQDKNVDVVAAFTSFSAFDYLHESDFDAVVMNALEGSEPAMTIAETMRRNPRLFHVPTLLLVRKTVFRDADVAYSHGVKDLIDASAPPEELSGRILELANDCRLHKRLKTEFSNLGGVTCSDPETGALNTAFLNAHLKRVAQDCRNRQLPLSVLTIKLVPKLRATLAADGLSKAFAQSIRNIASIVRMQDIVGRVDADTLIVAFPEEFRKDVARIAARITEMIETSTFPDAGDTADALRMSVKTAILEQVEPVDDPAQAETRTEPISA
ncbi:MAG: diguanylate cyclase [Litorimonas sp.]